MDKEMAKTKASAESLAKKAEEGIMICLEDPTSQRAQDSGIIGNTQHHGSDPKPANKHFKE